MTFAQIIETIKTAYQQTGAVNSVWFQPEMIDSQRQTIFPALYIEVEADAFDPQTNGYSITCTVLDVIDANKEDPRLKPDSTNFYETNLIDILSNVANTHTKALNLIRRGPAWVEGLQIDDNVSMTPIVREHSNNLAGWSAQYSITTPATDGSIC